MTSEHNHLGQPVGMPMPEWQSVPFPEGTVLRGRYCHLERVNVDQHAQDLIDSRTGQAVGLASYLRINPEHGVIEVGHLHFSPVLQKTAAATEAMYLMMKHAFEVLGYRRYEWKCDSLNTPSRKAALRLGFTFEGIFRQALVYKGRSRDTAWFSMLDGEWPELKKAFEQWLHPDNFTRDGQQLDKLQAFQP